MRNYGKEPRLLGQFDVQCPEFMCYVSLPIRMAGSLRIMIPDRLSFATELVYAAEAATCFEPTELEDAEFQMLGQDIYEGWIEASYEL